MIRMRGHHLICLHFFQGEGYSPEFIDNLGKVVKRAESEVPIIIVDGSDDICAACPYLDHERCAHKPDSEQAIKLLDQTALGLLEMKPRQRIKWRQAREKTMSIPDERLLEFCGDCDWKNLCGKRD